MILKNIIFLTLFSGMRLGEIAGLKWAAIDLDKKIIQIELTRLYNPEDGVYEETTKTTSSARSIAIPDICIDHLRRLKVQQMERKLILGQLWGNDAGFVFLNESGCPMSPPGLARRFTRYIEKEGLKKISFHGLRHTHTSMLVHMKLDIVQVSKRLGHSQLSTTQNIYTHLFKDTAQQIADELENTFATILPPKAKNQR